MPRLDLTPSQLTRRVGFAKFKFLFEKIKLPALACSFRLLNPDYQGFCITVGINGSTYDIGFNKNWELDVEYLNQIISNLGADTVYLQTWYDQSGNDRHLTSSSDTMPELKLDLSTRASFNVNVSTPNQALTVQDTSLLKETQFTAISVNETYSNDSSYWLTTDTLGVDSASIAIGRRNSSDLLMALWDGEFNTWNLPYGNSSNSAHLHYTEFLRPGSTYYFDGSYQGNSTSNPTATPLIGTNKVNIGATSDSGRFFNGVMYETILFESLVQENERVSLEEDINKYYNLF